jgi:hypothetical protein
MTMDHKCAQFAIFLVVYVKEVILFQIASLVILIQIDFWMEAFVNVNKNSLMMEIMLIALNATIHARHAMDIQPETVWLVILQTLEFSVTVDVFALQVIMMMELIQPVRLAIFHAMNVLMALHPDVPNVILAIIVNWSAIRVNALIDILKIVLRLLIARDVTILVTHAQAAL